ncbi:DUF452 family protein [Puteibacter caeruleilacunae]|nr:DUF452 family protein [Puteibacter caeruleilacunae]
MKRTLINNNSDRLILFFNGWGMDEQVIKNVLGDYDVLTLSAYHVKGELPIEQIKKYNEIYVVAWSMGVWVADCSTELEELSVKKYIAINGTPKPIDNQLGIPERIFKGTLDTLNERNRNKFQMRMFGGVKEFAAATDVLPKRELKEQTEELQYFWDQAKDHHGNKSWDKAFVGSNDLIFPADNLSQYWNLASKTEVLEMPHFPFCVLDTWDRIVAE